MASAVYGVIELAPTFRARGLRKTAVVRRTGPVPRRRAVENDPCGGAVRTGDMVAVNCTVSPESSY